MRPIENLQSSNAQSAGHKALDTYTDTLAFLTMSGSSRHQRLPPQAELLFLQDVEGLENLYRTMSAVAPAIPDAHDEEWNPLSQRPHSPLPPVISDELGAEITSLKEAVDAFTTLSHEMMHVALWEPFFTGHWRPRSRRSFREFSLMAEGFCFFFADILVSGAVRVRLPDGEFALERETPSSAHFHPMRAFKALGIHDRQEILGIYLDGFIGQRTALSQAQAANDFPATLAVKLYSFYKDSLPYLDDLHKAIISFGGLTEFYQRFCAIPGLPSFLRDTEAKRLADDEVKAYFSAFFQHGLSCLAQLTPTQVLSLRWRRMLQMRAFYALQLRYLLSEGQVIARDWSAPIRRRLLGHVETYLDGLQRLVQELGREPETSPVESLRRLDAGYDAHVRSCFIAHDAWVGHRWLIAPCRAGGSISVFAKPPTKLSELRSQLLDTVEFLVDELSSRIGENKTAKARALALAHIKHMAALGATGADGNARQIRAAMRKLNLALAQTHLLPIWSLPLASFDPVNNQYRELLFSFK